MLFINYNWTRHLRGSHNIQLQINPLKNAPVMQIHSRQSSSIEVCRQNSNFIFCTSITGNIVAEDLLRFVPC
jgi:hypothetical protein